MKSNMFTVMAICAASILGLVNNVSAQQTVRFGAGQQGSQNYGVNAALAQAVDAQTDLSVTVQAFGGPTAYLPLVNSGELDMAAVVTPDAGDAVRGAGPFQGMPQGNLSLVAPLLPSPVGLMVRADSDIESIADLRGKRVAWGIPAQASLQPYIEGALANGGLSAADVQQVPVASIANGVQALVSGSVDATLFALRGGAVVEADAATGGIRWLPFDKSAEAVERMTELAPEAYIFEVEEGMNIVGMEEPFSTMSYDYVLVARSDLDAEAVRAVATMLRDQVDEIASSNSILGAMNKDTIQRSVPGIPIHPGAKGVLGQ